MPVSGMSRGYRYVKTPDGVTVVYSSRPRTLIDAVYDWSRFSGLPRAYGWIKREIAHKRVSESAIVAATLSYGDIGTVRRIGVLLERLGVNSHLLRKLDDSLHPSSGLIPWVPTEPRRGHINRRWGVIENGSEGSDDV